MPTRSRQLTEKGFELLERNLRGKCKAGIRSANTVANKLGPLLKDENVDIECVKSYVTELEQCVSVIVDSQICYDDKFADYPDILAEFYEWFQPRFDTLSSVLSYTREFVSTCNVNMADSPLEMLTMTFILIMLIMTLGLKIVYLRFLIHIMAAGLLAGHHVLVKCPVKLPVKLPVMLAL